jgi:hypothetical protein
MTILPAAHADDALTRILKFFSCFDWWDWTESFVMRKGTTEGTNNWFRGTRIGTIS